MEDFHQSCEDIVTKVDSLKKQLEKTSIESSCTNSQFSTNSVIYTCSKEDPVAVSLICKNLEEFTPICSKNGFNLVIQQEPDNGLTIRLVQSSAIFSSRNAFKELDKLVKIKNELDEEKENRYQSLVDNMKQDLELKWLKETQMLKEQMEQMEISWKKEKEESVNASEDSNKLIKLQSQQMEQMTTKLSNLGALFSRMSVDRFLEERNVKTLRESPVQIDKICDILSEGVEELRLSSTQQKRKTILDYLDLLQLRTSEIMKIHLDITRFIFFHHDKFVWKLTEEEKTKASNDMKLKFNLDNIVGTIHPLAYPFASNVFVMYLAIVDQKIVHWRFNNTGFDEILRIMHYHLRSDYRFYKFATQFHVDTTYSDVFIEVHNDEIFKRNEKVITWMRNNFKSLETGLNSSFDHYVFPALYNMSLKYILEA